MTIDIDKAIEILDDLTTTLPQYSPDDRREAVLLSIEALRAIKQIRLTDMLYQNGKLPGETE